MPYIHSVIKCAMKTEQVRGSLTDQATGSQVFTNAKTHHFLHISAPASSAISSQQGCTSQGRAALSQGMMF